MCSYLANDFELKEKKQIVSDLEQKLSRTEHEASVMTAEIKALKGQLERKTAVEEQTRRGIQKVLKGASIERRVDQLRFFCRSCCTTR